MKTIVVSNLKGGVGKSTVACHLAYHFAEKGKRVAFINADTQVNSSKALKKVFPTGGDIRSDAFFSREVFPIDGSKPVTIYEGGMFLADVTKEQVGFFKPQVSRLEPHFDYCVIDTGPSVGPLQLGPLTAADYVISPVELEDFSMDGVADMLKLIVGVRQRYNPKLVFLGMLPNLLNNTSPRQKSALRQLFTQFPQFVFGVEQGLKLSVRQALPEALAQGIPVWKLKKTAAREAAEEMQSVLALIDERIGAV
jgi:chromosome partitioning protein